MTRRKLGEDDRTPSEPFRLKSPAALNLHELAVTAKQLAFRYDQAERDKDGVTASTIGLALLQLGRDVSTAGLGIVGQHKRRGA